MSRDTQKDLFNVNAPSFQPKSVENKQLENNEKAPIIEHHDNSPDTKVTGNGVWLQGLNNSQTATSDMIAQFSNMTATTPYDPQQVYYFMQPSTASTIPSTNFQPFAFNSGGLFTNRLSSANKPVISTQAAPAAPAGSQFLPYIQYPRMFQVPLMFPNNVPSIPSAAGRSRRNSCLTNKVFNTGDENIDKHLTDLYKRVNPRSEFNKDITRSRFFVIKSYTEDHVHRSIKYGEWCSTQRGNDILDKAYQSVQQNGHVYLFFSVNGSGYFCGVAEMSSNFDPNRRSAHWNEDKWSGGFAVEWLYVKDVPNKYLKHIILEHNDNRPITNSRDATEIKPIQKGNETLRIIHEYHHNSSLFDDFEYYETREKQNQANVPKVH